MAELEGVCDVCGGMVTEIIYYCDLELCEGCMEDRENEVE